MVGVSVCEPIECYSFQDKKYNNVNVFQKKVQQVSHSLTGFRLSHKKRKLVHVLQCHSGSSCYRMEGIFHHIEIYVQFVCQPSVESSEKRSASRKVFPLLTKRHKSGRCLFKHVSRALHLCKNLSRQYAISCMKLEFRWVEKS
jgi:hypothetical protein